jgi:hypothetical protein
VSVFEQLSNFVDQKGNAANIALAQNLARSTDNTAIAQLVEGLQHENKKIRHDCLKVLYELGYLSPKSIAPYCDQFINLLQQKDNRLVWGAMIAISTIAHLAHQKLFKKITIVNKVIQSGSTITIDNGVKVLAVLNKNHEYRSIVEPMLTHVLWNCPIKQLPMYIENSLDTIDAQNHVIFEQIINNRLPECEKESQTKRLTKALKVIQK